MEAASAKHYRWAHLPAENLKGGLTRRLISGERMMIAHVYFKMGDDVPRHRTSRAPTSSRARLHFRLGRMGERELMGVVVAWSSERRLESTIDAGVV